MDDIHALARENPGYEHVMEHLQTLLTAYPPPFIFVHDAIAPRLAARAVRDFLTLLASAPSTSTTTALTSEGLAPRYVYAQVNAVACISARVFFDTALNALAGWRAQWVDGCTNWGASEGERWNDSLDGFLHGLRAVRTRCAQATRANGDKGQGKSRAEDDDDVRMILVVERAERIKDTMPELLVPLTRLSELSQTGITTIFLSDQRWEDLRPPLGASPDPFRLDISPPPKSAALSRLAALFPAPPPSSSLPPYIHAHTYHPALQPLHAHFLSTLYGILSPFAPAPDELAYAAAARWPGFVRPWIDEAERLRAEAAEDGGGADQSDVPMASAESDPQLAPPDEATRMRLLRHFTPSFTAALDALYPRHTSAAAWACASLSTSPQDADAADQDPDPDDPDAGAGALGALPRMHRFVLVAAYLASTNPAKSDSRIFGRGAASGGRGRKKGGGTRKPRAGGRGGAVKIPPRLLGPAPFPLDRLLAILGVLLEEYDSDAHTSPGSAGPQQGEDDAHPGARTELALQRVGVYGAIADLAAARLLVRTTPAERLDGPPAFRCGAGVRYATARALARGLRVPLGELMWEAG